MSASAKSNRCPTCKRVLFRRHGLTACQWEVAEQIYKGLRDKEIALVLNKQVKTIKSHAHMIRKILGGLTRTQLILKIKELKEQPLIEPDKS